MSGTHLFKILFCVSMLLSFATKESLCAENALKNNGLIPNRYGFADIVDPLKAAVVNISTQSLASDQRNSPLDLLSANENSQYSNGSPFEDLFRRFFEEGFQGRSKTLTSLGSGFIIYQDKQDVFIVTCLHIISDADIITITLHDGQEFEAQVIGRDRRTDLALLKIKSEKQLTTLEWGDSNTSRAGEWIIAIGNPYGLKSSVTHGIISTIERDLSLRVQETSPLDYEEGFIQVDAAMNVGNSGGPILNIDGKVIGISTAILSPNGGNIGIGFAIPSAVAKNIVDQLKAFGHTKRGWLGLKIQPVTSEIAQCLGLKEPKGALVRDITLNSPAARADLKRGDIILTFNGQPLQNSRQLSRLLSKHEIGKKAKLEIWREGKEVNVEVLIGEYVDSEKDESSYLNPLSRSGKSLLDQKSTVLGMSLQSSEISRRSNIGPNYDIQGLMVMALDPESPAALKGIRIGDIISEVKLAGQTQKVKTVEQLKKIIDEARQSQKKQIMLLIYQDESIKYICFDL